MKIQTNDPLGQGPQGPQACWLPGSGVLIDWTHLIQIQHQMYL